LPKKWWYDTINHTLADLEEGVGFNRAMAAYAETVREQLMQRIVQEQPYGHEEMDAWGHAVYAKPPDYTVSNRIGHTPIEEGWRIEAEGFDDRVGLRLKISNVSQHIKYILEGSPPHDIFPRRHPYLFFWWGAPQQWEPPDGLPADYYRMFSVEHPGQPQNPFVRRAKNLARPEMTDTIKTGVTEYIANLMADSGLRPA